uniref:Uncharacterized protein n=1 Tax=Hyaloperonospora arabidopsidis (strain Emoy2) TaxID=559515 RepID=M4BWE5_HYAAE
MPLTIDKNALRPSIFSKCGNKQILHIFSFPVANYTAVSRSTPLVAGQTQDAIMDPFHLFVSCKIDLKAFRLLRLQAYCKQEK